MHADLDALVRRQHGVVTRAQLLAHGSTPGAIRWALHTRRLVQVHPRVYAYAAAVPERGRLLAAVLACGPRAVLSHRSAARLWGLDVGRVTVVDVTVPRRTGGDLSGVVVHRSRRPVRAVVRHGIPVTDVGRTLVDLADVVDYDVLHKAAMDAERIGLTRLAHLRPIPGRAGSALLVRLLDHVRERTRSELGKEVLTIVRRAGLPEPARNVVIGRFTVDMAWPAQQVIVEADSWRWHSSREAFDADRARDLELHRLGWTVLRVTWSAARAAGAARGCALRAHRGGADERRQVREAGWANRRSQRRVGAESVVGWVRNRSS